MVYDVVLGERGYMVQAGTYERRQAAPDAARAGRVRLFDFYGGARRANQLERDRFWRGLCWPTLDSQGVQPVPARRDVSETVNPALDPAHPVFSFVYRGTSYVVNGRGLYRLTVASGAYAGLQTVQQLAEPAVAVAQLQDWVVFAHGPAENKSFYHFPTGQYHTPSPFVGRPSRMMVPVHDWVLADYGDPDDPTLIYSILPNGAGTSGPVSLGSEVLAMAAWRGKALVVTRNDLWQVGFEGPDIDPKVLTTTPRAGFADDFAWLVGHQGQLYTWLGKEVHRYDPKDDVFVPMGLRGRATYGACGLGRWFMVALTDEITDQAELWAWDGRGWWLLDEADGALDALRWPVPISGAADDADLLALGGPDPNRTGVYQVVPRLGRPALRDTFSVVTSLLDAGERDVEKAWRTVGVEFAWPDPRDDASPVQVSVFVSLDGGQTWIETASGTIKGTSARTHSVVGTLAAAARSRWLQVRVEITGITTWCPVLTGIWAEFETIDPEMRRRRWEFAVQVKDAVVRRDGSIDTTGARELAAWLWDAWASGGVVRFEDVDHGLTGREYTVRIVGIREEIPKPQDAAEWGDGWVALSLVEV